MLWSQPRQLTTVVDTTMDPMMVEATIQGPSLNRCSASEPGHVAVTITDMVDNPPGDVQPTSDNEDGSTRNALCTPPRPAQSSSIQEEIESRICIPLQTPIIRAGPKVRRSKTPRSGFTLRRNERIARKPRAANSML